mmetsp:Transcript_49817/g.80754  ORF Transcript_49817/g.80754 Transcript_49817/m.80754 type:complete len:239 (+) Transcript_49817:187-903(+)
MASTPAATSDRTLSLSEGRVPTAAATRRQLLPSFVAIGKSACFFRSVRATSATIRPAFVTMGSFPFLESFRRRCASGRSTPSSAICMAEIFVMTWPTRVESLPLMKSQSRLETKPKSMEPMHPSSVTGKPLKPHCFRSLSSSERVIRGLMQTGSVMKPFLNRLTFATSATCSSTVMFEWITPIPPSRAMAMAILDSVTVSMGLDTMGNFSRIPLENCPSSPTSCTPKLMCPGRQIKSS